MKPWQRLTLALAAAVVASLLVRKFDLLGHLLPWAETARGMGVEGALLGVAAIVVSTLLFLPLNPLIILAGWVWGYWGVLVVVPAAVISAATAFSLARALGQTAVAQAMRGHPKVERVVLLAERGGVLTVAFLRVSLLMPFTPGNATLGLTRMPLRDVLLGTALGMILPTTAFISLGVMLPDADAIRRGDLFPPGRALALGAAGLALALAVGALVARRLHRHAPPP